MTAKVSVWVDKFVAGWSGEEGDQPITHPVVTVEEALRAQYDTDAHFSPCRLDDVEQGPLSDCPRLKNETLEHLADYGMRAVTDVAVADVDHADTHAKRTAEPPQEWRDAMWDLSQRVCKGAAIYETNGGLRIIVSLPHTMEVREAAVWSKRWREFLRQQGLPADEIQSPLQCYRLHNVLRNGKRQARRAVICDPAVFAFPETQNVNAGSPAGIEVQDPRQPFKLPRRIPEGERHQTLVRYAAQLRWQSLGTAEIEAQLREVNARRCRPPAPEAEIVEIARWAGEQEDGQQARQAAAGRVAPPADPDAQGEAEEDEEDPFSLGDHTEIARRIIERLSAESSVPMVAALNELWRYEDLIGYWVPLKNHLIEKMVHEFSGLDVRTVQPNGQVVWRPMKINDSTVVGVVKSIHRLLAQPDFFADAPSGVALKDCWVRVTKDGVERLPHAPWQKATTGYDFSWTEEVPEVWNAMLKDYWGHKDSFSDKCKILMEFIGASIAGVASTYQVCIILKGSGSNGKSSTLTVVVGLFPKEAVSSVSPQQFGSESYRAMLAEARLNVVGELPEKKIKQEAAAALKALISGDEVVAKWLYKNPFRFKPKAGHIVSCNGLPDVEDDSDGFFRRFIILDFDVQFTPSGDSRNIAEEVLAEDRARIVCAALRAVPELMRRGKFLTPKESVDEVTAWRNGQDEISLFLEDCTEPCEAKRGNGSDGDSLYTRYAVWAPQNGYEQMNKNRFLAMVDKRRKRFYDNGVGRRMYPVTLIR